ncbi:MAG TPA: hypothetical protein VJI96_03860 [Candidatus Andersenbacteria bacterium]|nr:hypothetical protein [Candidatus Andersenbacteria bacterium]
MYFSKAFFAILAPVLVGTLALGVHAQTNPAPFGNRGDINEQDIYHPPEVFVLSANAHVQENRTVDGSITFWNKSKDIVGDLTYIIELLGELPAASSENQTIEDNAPVYDLVTSKERFTLLGDKKMTVPFTYTPPENLPAGNYRIEITVATGRGRTMGWYDIPITFTGDKTPFAMIRSGNITIAEYGSKTFNPESGPNIQGGETILLHALATSESAKTVVPVLDIYKFSPLRPVLKTIRGSTVRATIDGTPLTMTVPTFREPGVYVGMLSLQDISSNKNISNLVKYRWVVRGADADVLNVRMKSYGSQKKDVMSFSIDYVGAGDAETKSKGAISIELQDASGTLGTLEVPAVELNDIILTGDANIVLHRKLDGNPVFTMNITAENGAELVSYRVPFSFTSAQRKTLERDRIFSNILLYGGIVLTLFGAVLLGNTYFRKKHKKRK